jgi:hypothetical protein
MGFLESLGLVLGKRRQVCRSIAGTLYEGLCLRFTRGIPYGSLRLVVRWLKVIRPGKIEKGGKVYASVIVYKICRDAIKQKVLDAVRKVAKWVIQDENIEEDFQF